MTERGRTIGKLPMPGRNRGRGETTTPQSSEPAAPHNSTGVLLSVTRQERQAAASRYGQAVEILRNDPQLLADLAAQKAKAEEIKDNPLLFTTHMIDKRVHTLSQHPNTASLPRPEHKIIAIGDEEHEVAVIPAGKDQSTAAERWIANGDGYAIRGAKLLSKDQRGVEVSVAYVRKDVRDEAGTITQTKTVFHINDGQMVGQIGEGQQNRFPQEVQKKIGQAVGSPIE